MGFGAKLRTILVLVGIVPVGVIGFLSYRASRDELTAVVQQAQRQSAEALARDADAAVGHALDALTLTTQALPLETFSKEELTQVLRIPYRQVGGLTAIALIDGDGNAVVPPVFEREAGREAPALEQMARHVPLKPALASGAAVGPPYVSAEGALRVVIAVRTGAWVVAGELSLRPISARLAALEQRGTRAVLTDGSGVLVWGTPGLSVSEQTLAAGAGGVGGLVDGPDGQRALASFEPTPGLGWGVLISQPQSAALAAATRVRDYTIYWAILGLLLAGALGVWLARSVTQPVAALTGAARALAEGRYETEPPTLTTRDELAEFADTFRQMAQEIRRRDAEITGWNRELQARVDARSAELKSAQDQILRTSRLAALGSMGAGIAHELNNPLTGVLGLVGLVLTGLPAESADAKTLTTVLEQSRKMSAIIARLSRLAQDERAEAGAAFQLGRPVRAALGRMAERLEQAGIKVTCRQRVDVPDIQGNEAQLEELVGHLLDNAIAAMPKGGNLDVEISVVDGQALKLCVTDTGRGIPAHLKERIFDPFFTTKQDATAAGVGLGLSNSHQIVARHHGRITVVSEVEKGSTFTVLLPAAAARPHLT